MADKNETSNESEESNEGRNVNHISERQKLRKTMGQIENDKTKKTVHIIAINRFQKKLQCGRLEHEPWLPCSGPKMQKLQPNQTSRQSM